MKNEAELRNRVFDELNRWFVKACSVPFSECYLWYRATTEDYPGELIIATERPSEEFMIAARIYNGMTVEGNWNKLILPGFPGGSVAFMV